MKAIVQLNNRVTLEIDDKDEMDTLSKAIVLAHPKTKCVCGNAEGMYFSSNKDTEGNIYVNNKCPKCGAASKLGRYKTGGFFWHNFEVYTPNKSKE